MTQIDSGSNNIQLFSFSLSKKIDTDLKAINKQTTMSASWILLKNMDQLDDDIENGEWKHPDVGDDDAGSEWRQLWDPQNRIMDFGGVYDCAVCGKPYNEGEEEDDVSSVMCRECDTNIPHRHEESPLELLCLSSRYFSVWCRCESGLWENQETQEKCLVPAPAGFMTDGGEIVREVLPCCYDGCYRCDTAPPIDLHQSNSLQDSIHP